nr:MAG TPA: hypothetical protein [Caudoviricetes sp.]
MSPPHRKTSSRKPILIEVINRSIAISYTLLTDVCVDLPTA